jgi:hypothetical protein
MVLTNYNPNELADIVQNEYKIKSKMAFNFFDTIVKDNLKVVS